MRKLIIGLLALSASLVGVVGTTSSQVSAEICSTNNILQTSPTKYGGIAECRALDAATKTVGQETVQVKLKCATNGVATPNVFRFGNVEWRPGSFDTNGFYSVYYCGDTTGDGLNVLQSSLTYTISHDAVASGCTVSYSNPPASNPGTGSAKCTSLPGHTDVVRVEFKCATAAGVVDVGGLHLGSWIGTPNVNSTSSCDPTYYPYVYAPSLTYSISST